MERKEPHSTQAVEKGQSRTDFSASPSLLYILSVWIPIERKQVCLRIQAACAPTTVSIWDTGRSVFCLSLSISGPRPRESNRKSFRGKHTHFRPSRNALLRPHGLSAIRLAKHRYPRPLCMEICTYGWMQSLRLSGVRHAEQLGKRGRHAYTQAQPYVHLTGTVRDLSRTSAQTETPPRAETASQRGASRHSF